MESIVLFPFTILEIYIFALGVSLYLSALFVKFRDISYIWQVSLQAGFYLTPILYPLTQIKNVEFQKILLLNPLAQAIQDARYAVVSHDPVVITTWHAFKGGIYAIIPVVFVLAVLVTGIFYFRGQSKYFAENL
jgi:ABC-2 type transport system permease protein